MFLYFTFIGRVPWSLGWHFEVISIYFHFFIYVSEGCGHRIYEISKVNTFEISFLYIFLNELLLNFIFFIFIALGAAIRR